MTLTSLQVSSLGCSPAGQEKEGKLATFSLEFEFRLQFFCDFPLTELSDFRQLA